MASSPDARPSAIVVCATILGAGALWYVTLGTAPNPVLAWLAPIPVFALALRLPARAAFGAAFLAHALGGLALWSYLHGVIGVPIPIVLLLIAGSAALYASTTSFMRALGRRWTAWQAALATGACAGAIDLLVAHLSVHGSFGSIAYTQVTVPVVTQLASLGGTPLIVFAMTTVAAAAAFVIAPVVAKGRTASALLAVVTVAATLLFGALRIARAPLPDRMLPVVLLAADAPRNPPRAASPAGQALIARYDSAVRALRPDAQQLVLLPERIVDLDGTSQPAWAERWGALARERRTLIVTGAATADRNAAFLFGADGGREVYFKQHLLPPFELVFTPGVDVLLRAIDSSRTIGVMICKDADFAALGLRYANAGIRALIVPAWDFSVDGDLHARMAMLRGIEGGYAVVRSARSGMLTVSDAYGRVHGSMPSSSAAMSQLRANTPLYALRTPYSRIGDAFGVACVLLTIAGCAELTRRARRDRTQAGRPDSFS